MKMNDVQVGAAGKAIDVHGMVGQRIAAIGIKSQRSCARRLGHRVDLRIATGKPSDFASLPYQFLNPCAKRQVSARRAT